MKTNEDKLTRSAELAAKYPYLVPASNSGKLWGATLAAENIRRELARRYPGVKFSVRSDRFSGGSSVDVEWVDGPTTKVVNGIIKAYEPYARDCSGDYWDYVGSDWADAFGSAKFVHAHRSWSGETESVLIAWAKSNPIHGATGYYDEPEYRAARLFDATDLPAGARVTGVELRPEEEECDAPGELAWWRVTFDLSQQPDPTPTTSTTTASSNTASSNTASDGTAFEVQRERDWTWIRFSAKPAPAVLDAVRSLGARWGRQRSSWYIPRPVDDAAIVNALTGRQVYDLGARAMEAGLGVAS